MRQTWLAILLVILVVLAMHFSQENRVHESEQSAMHEALRFDPTDYTDNNDPPKLAPSVGHAVYAASN